MARRTGQQRDKYVPAWNVRSPIQIERGNLRGDAFATTGIYDGHKVGETTAHSFFPEAAAAAAAAAASVVSSPANDSSGAGMSHAGKGDASRATTRAACAVVSRKLEKAVDRYTFQQYSMATSRGNLHAASQQAGSHAKSD